MKSKRHRRMGRPRKAVADRARNPAKLVEEAEAVEPMEEYDTERIWSGGEP